MGADSRGRRSAQTTMYALVHALARWLAPVLSFTAEEIYSHIPGEKEETVFLCEWTSLPGIEGASADDGEMTLSAAQWQTIIEARAAVFREMEQLRGDKKIGSSLDAEVRIFCDGAIHEALAALGDELHFVFITSRADLFAADKRPSAASEVADGVWVEVVGSKSPRCERCWHHTEDVGATGICARCETNINGDGETRLYA